MLKWSDFFFSTGVFRDQCLVSVKKWFQFFFLLSLMHIRQSPQLSFVSQAHLSGISLTLELVDGLKAMFLL